MKLSQWDNHTQLLLRMEAKLADVLQTLQNAKLEEIPPYAEWAIASIKEELARLNSEIKKQSEKNKLAEADEAKFGKGKLSILFDQIYRLKRFLLIYSKWRTDRIDDQFWYYGGDLHHSEKANLSEEEKAYFGKYKDLVMDYTDDVGVDLTVDLEPPLETEVEVRIIKDCGDVLDERGQVIKFGKNTSGLHPKRLVENFVRQGYAVIKR